eukprot:Skav220092  [mRNA]  locus=scaffold3578:10186:11094:- [translate_table: standard]
MGIKVNSDELMELEKRKAEFDKSGTQSNFKKQILLNVKHTDTKGELMLKMQTMTGYISMVFWFNDTHTFKDIAIAIKDYNDMDVGNALGEADFKIRYNKSYVEMWEPVASCVVGENPSAEIVPSFSGGAKDVKKTMYEKQKKMMGYKEKTEKTVKEIDTQFLNHVPDYKVAESKIMTFCQTLESSPEKAFDDIMLSMSVAEIDKVLEELNVKGTTEFKIAKASMFMFGLNPLQNMVENIGRVNEMGKSIMIYAIMKANGDNAVTTSLSDLKKRLERAKFHKIGAQSASSAVAQAGVLGDAEM